MTDVGTTYAPIAGNGKGDAVRQWARNAARSTSFVLEVEARSPVLL